ncbi:MAG: hypothetical protein ACPGWR_33660, partial [Ardenticatenaceae bacterium]
SKAKVYTRLTNSDSSPKESLQTPLTRVPTFTHDPRTFRRRLEWASQDAKIRGATANVGMPQAKASVPAREF